MLTNERAKSFLQLIKKSQRGRLRIYLGYGPGVGKTYQMLQEAHRLKADGIDVVVGFVEAHGREATARQVEGLEVLPRRELEYRGINLSEMNLEAILERKPHVVLIDELAHTNIPGSRNAKRYEDVQEILAAGIHVIATLNVQHLESLYNTVERLIGVKVRERLPDSVLVDADEVVNVDIAPEDLQRRLTDGKIYPHERIASALENFFGQGNLEHLRELTMREIASQIDYKRRGEIDTEDKSSPDQMMVCLASKGPNSASLLRYASRLAGRLNRNWYAVYVQTPSEDPTLIDATTQRLLADTLTLANQLGATVFTFQGEDVVETIINFAREYRVGHIVIGRPRPIPAWRRRILGQSTVAEKLISRSRGYAIVVVDAAGSSSHESRDYKITPKIEAHHLTLNEVLQKDRILFVDYPVTRADILQRLVQKLASSNANIQPDKVLESLMQREIQGSTFLNEGIALPHIRVKGLAKAEVIVAVTRQGILDVSSERPVEVVFLLLEPDEAQQSHLQLLSVAMRVFQNVSFRRALAQVETPEEFLQLISSIEDATGNGLHQTSGTGRIQTD